MSRRISGKFKNPFNTPAPNDSCAGSETYLPLNRNLPTDSWRQTFQSLANVDEPVQRFEAAMRAPNSPFQVKNVKNVLLCKMELLKSRNSRKLGRMMRKFQRFPWCASAFGPLAILAGALLLLAAFAPKANADLIAYYNFEGTPTSPYPVNLESHAPAFFSSGNNLILTYNTNGTLAVTPGLPQNLWPTDPAPNVTALGLSRSGANSPAEFDIPLFSSQGFFQNMTVSFAINAQGNGFTGANFYYSTNAGATFTLFSTQVIPSSGTVVLSAAVPTLANNAPNLMLRIELTGGQSNGGNLQNIVDNIRVEGTIVPEPATVAGGLLGVLGLCWHQRRRLIRSVRFRRT
jgi:hypothetical protein